MDPESELIFACSATGRPHAAHHAFVNCPHTALAFIVDSGETSAKDYYGILGVGKTADQKQIKSAYYQVCNRHFHDLAFPHPHACQLAKKYHPDTNPGDKEAAKKFQEISEAYTVCPHPLDA